MQKYDVQAVIQVFTEFSVLNLLPQVAVGSRNEDVVKLLVMTNWPGNVRQLENVIHHAMIMTDNDRIKASDIPQNIFSNVAQEATSEIDGFIKKDDIIITDYDLEEMEKSQIVKALEKSHWKVTRASELLGIHRNTLSQKMKKYNLK